MKKFIKNYWWAIAIAVIVFLRKRNAEKTLSYNGSKTGNNNVSDIKSFIGHSVKVYFTDAHRAYASNGKKGTCYCTYEQIGTNPRTGNPTYRWVDINSGSIIKIINIIVEPNQRLCGNGWCSEPFTRYQIYLSDGGGLTISENELGNSILFEIVD